MKYIKYFEHISPQWSGKTKFENPNIIIFTQKIFNNCRIERSKMQRF